MAVTAKVYNKYLFYACRGETPGAGDTHDILNHTIKCALLTSSYTPNQVTHIAWSTIVSNEVSGTGYSAGGAALTTKAWGFTSQILWFDADDAEWAGSTITARYAVIYDDTPAADADKILIAYIDFGTDESSVGGLFKIQWSASGIFKITIA